MTTALDARTLWVEDYVREHCFDGESLGGSLTFGAELEFLAFDASSHHVAPIIARDGLGCSLDAVRDVARQLTWRETVSGKGVPQFASSAGGSLTFEPGGQLEYASAVHRSIDSVLAELCTVETLLRESAERVGIVLMTCGVDPFNGAEGATLQLGAKRYRQMAQYFAAIGPDGARMMGQTASLQINVGGIVPSERWRVANAITPWLVALFANSARYAGVDTGCASYRAETWRGVDPSRTGVFAADDAVRDYAAFALAAPAFLADESAPAFRALDEAMVSRESLSAHLSTLFPEVRPRRYLEVRSIDSVDHARRRQAMALVSGILGDAIAASAALELVGPASADLLCRAGRTALRDAKLASVCSDLVTIAREGCARLGPRIVSEESLGSLSAL